MKIKLFGKELFSMGDGGPKAEWLFNTAADRIKQSEYLPDFYRQTGSMLEYDSYVTVTSIADMNSHRVRKGKKAKVKKDEKPPKVAITPKGVYELQMLNDKAFKIKVDPTYVDQQIAQFKDKLGMIKSTEWDMDRGTVEISSILARMENRKKYEDHRAFFEEFPYTTTEKIGEMTKLHDHLKMGQVEQFLADMPQEAIDVMKRYTDGTKKLCEKKPIFYIIANKKDFQKTEKRRDPILLAQSPFGHFWQILGAWDEEMLIIEEL